MLLTDIDSVVHPGEIELSGLLENSLSAHERSGIEKHLAECDECLAKISSAHEAVRIFKNKRKIGGIMKNVNIYLLMAALSFTLSFFTPRYFLQLLVATIILGIKWVVDSKTTKMLVMIHQAWKNGGEEEASRIIEKLDSGYRKRF